MSSIIAEIFTKLDFSDAELVVLESKLKRVTLQKGEFLLQADVHVDQLYYVHTGCLRSYFSDASGKEHILQFAVKGWWISDYIALFGSDSSKAVSYIECIQDAILYSISKHDFDRLCQDMPKIAYFHIRKMEGAFASFQNRILENLTLTAKERYLNFIDAYPSIESSVKNYHIASYLGITTESLSRIRKEISSHSV